MRMNSLTALSGVFEQKDNEIFVSEDLIEKALVPLRRMLDFKVNG